MTVNLKMPDIRELKPHITVFGVGGAGGNAVNNMITAGLQGVEFVVANTDAQALAMSRAERIIQMGVAVTEGLGAGSQPEVGRAAAEEVMDEIRDHLTGAHMVFITAGMGGGTGTGAAPVIARAAREHGILTVGVVTKPFQFEGQRRKRVSEAGITELQKCVDTLIVIPNQNLFRVANERTTFADAFGMADQVLYSGVACITDLMVKEGLINLDFADVRAVMREMGKAMMGTGEASGDKRAVHAAEAAIANPLLDDVSMKGARGLLISITGGKDLTLYEVDEAATRIREEVDEDANIILGATFDDSLEGVIRVSVVATGIDQLADAAQSPEIRASEAPLRKPLVASKPHAPAQPSSPRVHPSEAEASPEPVVAHAAEGVTIHPYQPGPALYDAPHYPERAPEPAAAEAPEAFIPPLPERPEARAPRMPRIEEFPLPVQQQIAARDHSADPGAERRGFGLLRRLASVGLTRDEHHGETPVGGPAEVPMLPAPVRDPEPRREPQFRAPAEPARRPPQPAPSAAVQRGRPGEADPTARQQPRAGLQDEDHLEIPAFLRRQNS